MKFLWALLFIGYVKVVMVYRIYNLLPLHELKRQARSTDENARKIYKVAATQPALDVLLWLVGVVLGTAVVITASAYAWWAAAAFIVFAGWLLIWAPKPKQNGWSWRVAAFAADYYFKAVSFLAPVLNLLASLLPASRQVHLHTGLYEKQDLMELINTQNHQLDNRIPEEDLKIAFGALTFGDKKVTDVMTPRKALHFVAASEHVGPILIDELHKTGFMRFPVIKELKKNVEPEVIGTLLLKDVIGLDKEGSADSLMHKGAQYINESDSLRDALDAFIKTKAHLLVVVNKFEEVSGVLSLEDVLGLIIGQQLEVDFDDYADLKAVAGKQSQKTEPHHEPTVKK